jgi:hypothetical protein
MLDGGKYSPAFSFEVESMFCPSLLELLPASVAGGKRGPSELVFLSTMRVYFR